MRTSTAVKRFVWATAVAVGALGLASSTGFGAQRGGGHTTAPAYRGQSWEGGGKGDSHAAAEPQNRRRGDRDDFRRDGFRHDRGGRVHGDVYIGVSPWWGRDPYWWWGPDPYWWYGPPVYRYGPPVVIEEPKDYVEQPPPVPDPPTSGYWYYCPSAKAYYPAVSTCPEPWVKVPPRPE